MYSDSFPAQSPGPVNIQIRASTTGSSSRLVQVKVNGILGINYSFNGYTASQDFTKVLMARSFCKNVLLDDIIMDNSEWTGAGKVRTLLPNAVGSYSEWSPQPLSDANWEAASAGDISPSEGGSYVATSIALKKDSYNMEPFPSGLTATSVNGVQVHAKGKTTSGLSEYLQLMVKTGGGFYYSSSKHMDYGWSTIYNLWQNNPQTGSAWTPAQIAALEAGFRLVTS